MKYLLLLLSLLAVPASANEMMDRIVTCNRIAMGALLRIQGFGGQVKWISPQQMKDIQAMVDLHKEAMYVRDDGESAEEKEVYNVDLMKGWRMENDYIHSHAGQPKDQKEILDACMRERDVYRMPHGWGMVQVASSEGLSDDHMAKDRMCEFRGEILVRSIPFKGGFDSVDQLLQNYPFPDAWSEEFKAMAKQDIEGFYNFIGGASEYIQHFVARCKAHADL